VTEAKRGERPTAAKKPPGGQRDRDPAQLDLFWAFTGEVPLRDDREAMVLPLVSLAKQKRTKPIEWRAADGSRWVRVTANATHGMATIWDLDVVVWLVSQLNAFAEKGEVPPRTLRFRPHDMLRSIGRDVGGDHYRELEAALNRLRGTMIETNVRLPQTSMRRKAGFGWIDDWSHEIDDTTGRSRGMAITASAWIWEGVAKHRDVLAIPPAYFDITSGLGRWLYRLARRHAGKQATGWRWTFRHLHERSGSTQAFGEFSRDLRRLIAADKLPEYRLEEVDGQRGDAVLWAVRDPARIGLPQARTLRRITL
jgi:plasmid replication initiation protein